MTEDLLAQLNAWHAQAAPTLGRTGYTLEFAASGPSLPKPAAWVTLSSAERVGRLTVWVTGEAQLSLGDVRTGHVIDEHRDIRRDLDLPHATDALTSWVLRASAE